MSDDMPEWAGELIASHERLTSKLTDVETLISNIQTEIAPTIDKLYGLPIAKMMGLKK